MSVNRDPYVAVVFEWETGIKQEKKIHTVRLEIPPGQITMRMSKNVQKTVTTKGWVLNHGVDNLAVVSASGQAYQPRSRSQALEEGFNPEVAISGLEYLQAVFVSSGRLSSSPTLTTSIKTDLYQKTLLSIPTQGIERVLQTLLDRVRSLETVRRQVQSVGGFINIANNEVILDPNEKNNITNKDLEEVRITLSADVYRLEITEEEKQEAWNLLNSLNVNNVEIIQQSFVELRNRQNKFDQLVDKLDVLLSRAKNQNLKISSPKLDPSIGTLLRRDPFSVLKALAALDIFNKMRRLRSNKSLRALIDQESLADDWVITVYMYWQDMVLVGHFETFDISQSSEFIGLWNWSFTFVVHEGWLLKNNNIIPFTSAFDPHITNIEAPGSAPTDYRNINRPLERLVVKETNASVILNNEGVSQVVPNVGTGSLLPDELLPAPPGSEVDSF